jgi:hypothetical protein
MFLDEPGKYIILYACVLLFCYIDFRLRKRS